MRGCGGEGVAVGDGFCEVLGKGFEVELFLLARLEQGFDAEDVGFHVAERAEVVLVCVFFKARQALGGLVDALGEGVQWRFGPGFESDETHELGGEVCVVGLEVCFAAGDAGDDFLDLREVFVEFICFFADVDEALIWLVDFGESVDEGIGDAVEKTVAFRHAPARGVQAHMRVPVGGFEEDG